MDLPPFLKALSGLIEAFSDEPSLQGLHAELAWLAGLPAPATPPPAPASAGAGPAPPQFTRADKLREALGTYVGKAASETGLVRCPTPGCNKLRQP